MATPKNTNGNPHIIPAGAPKPDEGLFVVVYGKGGVGKTTTACMASNALLLDCTGGGRYQTIDTWRVHSTADLHGALEYLEKERSAYRTVILDSVDSLYMRSLKPDRDIRKSHKDTQGVVGPMLARFWSLPVNRVLVVNEKVEQWEERVKDDEGQATWKKFVDIHLNLPPKLSQLVDDHADVIMRAENSGRTDERGNPLPTTVRVWRVTEGPVIVQAKTRLDIIANKMRLDQALINLGIIGDDGASTPTGSGSTTDPDQPSLIPAGK